MELIELKAHIKSNTIPNFLVFTGEDWAVQKIYIDQIAKVRNLPVKRMETVQEIIPKLGNKTFVTSNTTIYTVRDDEKFVKDDKQWEKIISLLGNSMLILLLSHPDKRLKFFKVHEPAIVEFSALKPEILTKYIQKEIALSQKNCLKLVEVCEGNYGRILLEIDKIKQYAEHFQDSSVNEFFRTLLEDGTIYTPPKDAIFDLVDAILDRDIPKVYSLYEQCKAIGESTFAIMTVLFNNAKAVLQVQTCTNKDISKSTGLTGWQIMNAKKHLDVYDDEELINIIRLIARSENDIKTGQIDEKYVIDYLLVRVL